MSIKKNAWEDLGDGYICIPRSIADEMFSSDPCKKNPACLHFALLVLCSYNYQPVRFNHYTYPSKPGDLVTSERALAEMMGITRACLRKRLKYLADEGWIEYWKIGGAKRIRVLFYEEITRQFIRDKSRKTSKTTPIATRRLPTPTLQEQKDIEEKLDQERIAALNKLIKRKQKK